MLFGYLLKKVEYFDEADYIEQILYNYLMGLSNFLERKKVAEKLAKEALEELVYRLHVDERLAYLPEIKVGKLEGASATYDPDRHELIFEKEMIDSYLKAVRELKHLHTEIEKDQGYMGIHYNSLIKNQEEYVKNLLRSVKGVAFHEVFHTLRYRMHPEKNKEERIDPTRRLVEDALSDFAEAIFLDMSEEEIVKAIRAYRESFAIQYTEAVSGLSTTYTEAYENLIESMEKLGIKVSDKAKESVRREKKTAETAYSIIQGYRLGFLAALGMSGKPKEEKIAKVEEFLKNPDLKHILEELEKLGEKGIEIYKEGIKAYTERIFGEKEIAKWYAEIEAKNVYKNKKVLSIIIVALIGGFVLSFGLSKGITSMFISVSKQNTFSLIILSAALTILLSYFIFKKIK